MFSTRNFLVLGLLVITFSFQSLAQKSDSTFFKKGVYYGKSGFFKQKAIFLQVRNDSAFVYVFDGQSNFTLKEFYDTLRLIPNSVTFESANCILAYSKRLYSLTLKSNLKHIKLKPKERAELNNYINDSWINEQREMFFNLSKGNPKSYTLYDETVKNSGILNLLEKDPTRFLNAFNSAFKEVKPLDEEFEEN